MSGGAAPDSGCAVVIVNYRTPGLALDCLRSVADQRAEADVRHAILVDGGSDDGSAERIAAALAMPELAGWAMPLALPVNGGFGYANNQAILTLAATGALPPYVCLLNPDARPLPGALAAMARCLDINPRAAAVGALLVHEDGTPQGSAFAFPSWRGEFAHGVRIAAISRLIGARPATIDSAGAIRVPWVTGAAVMFRGAALAEVGLFDDGFFLYFEETELTHRLVRAGWDIWHQPAARVVHLGGVATDLRDPATGLAKVKRMPRYWYASRRRYYVRTGGAGALVGAGLAYLAGRLIGWPRALARRRSDPRIPHEGRDIAATSLPLPSDSRAAPPRLGDRPGAAPSWMAEGSGAQP